MKRKKTFYILRYIFAVVLIIGGLGNLSASVPFWLMRYSCRSVSFSNLSGI